MRYAILLGSCALLGLVAGAGIAFAQPDSGDMSGPPPSMHDKAIPPPADMRPGAPMDSDTGGGATLPQDQPVDMGGIEVACTGIGSAKDDPQWKQWPIRIEFSNGAAQYLIGVHMTVRRGGQEIGDFVCNAPWVLVRGGGGTYDVTAALTGHEGKTHGASFTLPGRGGQQRVEIQFPGMSAND